MRTGVRWWFPGFLDGEKLGGFPGSGEIFKHQDMVKYRVKWMRALRERCRSKTAEIHSVPGTDLVLRN
jgi:hypothetical protein